VIFTLHNPHPIENGYLGFLVRAAGSDFLVGSAGSNYVYLYSGSTGNVIREFPNPEPSTPAVNTYYGVSLATSGEYIMIGNPRADTGQYGTVYVFRSQNGALRYKIDSPLGQFNFGVTMTGLPNSQVLIGESYSNVGSVSRAGRAYLMDIGPPSAADAWWLNAE
jgi:hypothetical protein